MAGTRTETFAGPSRACVHDRPLYATHIPSFAIFTLSLTWTIIPMIRFQMSVQTSSRLAV